MKNLAVALLALSVIGLSSMSNNVETTFDTQVQELVDCKYGQCHATAKSTGNRCKHCVSNQGDMYCYQHD